MKNDPTHYIPAPLKFRKDQFDFEQVRREGMIAIYRQTKPNVDSEHFEVVKLTNSKAYTIHGVDVPAKENYPSSEKWGQMGWTYGDMVGARGKFALLVDEAEKKAKG